MFRKDPSRRIFQTAQTYESNFHWVNHIVNIYEPGVQTYVDIANSSMKIDESEVFITQSRAYTFNLLFDPLENF